MNAKLLSLPSVEELLFYFYSLTTLGEAAREWRTELATEYHNRTGRYYAARFYY